jgi:spore coat protein U-like protein
MAFALLGLTAPAWAATATTTFAVSGTVVPTCNVSAANLSFGTSIPSPINSNVDAQSNITATCSSGTPYTVALSAGNGAAATFASRKLTSGANTLNYALFTNAGRTTVWGDGSAGSSTFGSMGSGAAQAIPVYGRILSGQSVATGAYSDTIVVTLTF